MSCSLLRKKELEIIIVCVRVELVSTVFTTVHVVCQHKPATKKLWFVKDDQSYSSLRFSLQNKGYDILLSQLGNMSPIYCTADLNVTYSNNQAYSS